MYGLQDISYTAEGSNSDEREEEERRVILYGKCLSIEYQNSYAKLSWQCEKGYIWMSKPNTVKNRKWYPVYGVEYRIRKLRAFKKK